MVKGAWASQVELSYGHRKLKGERGEMAQTPQHSSSDWAFFIAYIYTSWAFSS